MAFEKHTTFVPGTIRATTSNDTQRYDNVASVKLFSTRIQAGHGVSSRELQPSYMPPLWRSPYTDPEGSRYFVCDSQPRIVTPSSPEIAGNDEKLQHWLTVIQGLLSDLGIPISEHLELWLRLDENDCDYYLVDHSTYKEFWLEELDSSSFLGPAVSTSHLDHAIQALYWTHVEQFPMHGEIPLKKLVELKCIFRHAQADQMTSEVSTFPFSRKESAQFSNLLMGAEDSLDDGRTVCVIARLWQTIASNWFWTHHGQSIARCSRDQSILFDELASSSNIWTSRLLAPVTFGLSNVYSAKLEEAYTDRLVYKEFWRNLVSTCLDDWKQTSFQASLGLLLHGVLFLSQGVAPFAGLSAACFLLSVVAAAGLQHQYDTLKNSSADRGHDHLSSIYSSRFRFTLVSLVFALPKTLYLWGITTAYGAFFTFLMATLTRDYGVYPAAFVGASVLLSTYSLLRITSESALPNWFVRRTTLEQEDSPV